MSETAKIASTKRAVILDVDGTLTDSIGRICDCMAKAAKNKNVRIPADEETKQIIGITLREAVAVLFPELDDPMVDEVTQEYRDVYNEWEEREPVTLFPNTLNILRELKKRGYCLGIATGKSKHGLGRLLENPDLCELFDGCICGSEAASKPNPEMLLKLLQRLDVEPQNAVMVGDSVLDIEMALNAGSKAIGVTTGVHNADNLWTKKPTAVLSSLDDLPSAADACFRQGIRRP